MTEPSATRQFIDLLKDYSPTEWAKISTGQGIDGAWRPYVPQVVWRFREPGSAIEATVIDAIQSYVGTASWNLEKPTRNWWLYPNVVRLYQQGHCLRGSAEASGRLASERPELAMQLLEDFRNLTAHVRRALESRSKGTEQ